MSFGDVTAAVAAMGKAAAAAFAYRAAGELRLAIVVKATFALAPEGPMVLVDPEPIVAADVHRDDDPNRALVAASDLVPKKPLADVLLRGHARAPRGAPTPAMSVRLMIAQDGGVVLDKRLAVRGAPDPSGKTREPAAFQAMQLAWELAARTPENPVGIAEGAGAWPHIVDPRNRGRAAGVGPVAPRWPGRRRLLAGLDEAVLAAPVPALPAELPWAYFQAAPEDQRIPFLRGDEWIGFEGLNAELPRVQSCLPGARGAARVYGPGAGRPLQLDADTLSIDADRLLCTVVWRGALPIASEHDLASLRVLAGVETAGHPIVFPASHAALGSSPPPAPPRPGSSHPFAETLAIDLDAVRANRGATPFEDAKAPAPPPAAGAPPRRAPRPLGASTIELDVEAVRRLVAAATPFEQAAAAPGPKPPSTPPEPRPSPRPAPHPLGASTIALDLAAVQALAPAMPFAPPAPHADLGATIVAAPERASPLPAATPFERARLEPAPAAEGPATIDLARQPPETPLTVGQLAAMRPEPPPAAPRPSPSAPAPPGPGPIETPTTLGGFFLAAMARAGKTPTPLARP